MEHQELFIEKLNDIVKLAKINKNVVTRDFIDGYFKELDLEEDKIPYIYEYLLQENIKIRGYRENIEMHDKVFGIPVQVDDDEESEYLRNYLEEIQEKGGADGINNELYERAKQGDPSAKSSIIEHKLKRVAVLSEELKQKGMSQSDLIQEGNIGLLLAVDNLASKDETVTEDEYLDEEIRKAMMQALDEFREDKHTSINIMNKAERLKTEAEKLAADLGDKMSLQDIAEFTGMDLEEMQDILRITGEN